MPFPDSPRVIYRKNPLAEVICQVRFPPVLRIESERPARFQEAIRGAYPLYAEVPVPALPSPPDLPEELAKLIQGIAPLRSVGVRHEFASEDRVWLATLARDVLTFKTTSYRRWEDFRQRLTALCDAFVAEYKPAFYTRVGLRYVDVIQRSALGLKESSWCTLLKPHIAGEFAAPEVAGDIETAIREVLVRLDDHGGRVLIRHGTAVGPGDEECFAIDSDFHTEQRKGTDHAIETLDEFNRAAHRLFRWCIQDRLHHALDPELVQS